MGNGCVNWLRTKPIIVFETASVSQGGDKGLWIKNDIRDSQGMENERDRMVSSEEGI